MKDTKCRFCGAAKLRWNKPEGGKWELLTATGERHKCNPLPNPLPKTPPSKGEAVVLLAKILAAIQEQNALLTKAIEGPRG